MSMIVFSENSNLANSVYGKCLDPLRLLIESKAEAYEKKSLLPLLFVQAPSTQYGEKLSTMTSMEGPQPVGEGGDFPYDGFQEGFSKTIEHMVWKDHFEVTREMVADNKILQLRSTPNAFVKGFYRNRELLGARYFAEAMKKQTSFTIRGQKFDTTTADGKCLFATNHQSKTGKGSNQSNLFADAFSADALGEAETRMHLFKDDNGNVLNVSPDTILIPSIASLRKAVYAAVGSNEDPNTANNAFNYQVGRWRVIEWPYLNQFLTANTAPWVLIDSSYNEDCLGAAWFDREKPEFTQRIMPNQNLGHDGYARYGVGFNDWRFACVGGVADGTQLISA